MATYADLAQDFVPRFPRTLTEAESSRATTLLEDASFWLSVWVPGLQAAIDGGNEQAETAAKLLVVAMVRRALLAPAVDDGIQSQLLQAGPYQANVVYRNPDGNLYLMRAELDSLKGLLSGNQSGAVSIMSPGL